MIDSESRDDLYRAQTMALATASASTTPDWLREMAWRTYGDMAWHLEWDYECSDTGETRSGLLLWDGVYGYGTREFMASMPDVIKEQFPVDVFLANGLAGCIDQPGHSTDFRLECLVSLYRTLWRLIDHAEDAGITVIIESFDSVLENGWFLAHLDRVINMNALGDDEDDDENDYDIEQFERGYNHHGANH